MPRLKCTRIRKRRRPLTAESLETRCLLAASFGWDGPGLGSAELTYTVSNAPSSLSQAQVDTAIQSAFDAWANVVDITFTEVSQVGLPDSIDISFTRLDGSGGTLAQAYFPDDVNPARIAGDIEFDLSESWEVGNAQGNRAFDLTWVAVHEIGHALGLNHSTDAGSVLRASVSPNQQFTTLDSDDIADIRQLYSSNVQPAAAEPTVQDPTDESAADEPVANNPTTNNDGANNDNRFNRWWNWFRRGNWWRWFGRAEGGDPVGKSPTAIAIPPSIAHAGGDTGDGYDDDSDRFAEVNVAISPYTGTQSGNRSGFAFSNSPPTQQVSDRPSERINREPGQAEPELMPAALDRILVQFARHIERS